MNKGRGTVLTVMINEYTLVNRSKIDHLNLYVCNMTVQQSTQQLLFSLFHIYDEREARNIADLVMESVTGWKRIDRIINKQVPVSKDIEILLAGYTQDLLRHKPVQYVLHEAWFYEMKFYVDEHVLIPRPETEELARWVVEEVQRLEFRVQSSEAGVGSREPDAGAGLAPALSELRGSSRKAGFSASMFEVHQNQPVNHINILDIGTGSGCIAIALQKQLPAARMYSCDVSKKALEVAAGNAEANQTKVEFILCDFLNQAQRNALPLTDIIVSNPPYIPHRDMETMHQHVTGFEPHIALFVADNDPFLFYKEIAGHAQTHLTESGQVFVELHEDISIAVSEVFRLSGFEIELRQDMQGKNRMLKAMRKLA